MITMTNIAEDHTSQPCGNQGLCCDRWLRADKDSLGHRVGHNDVSGPSARALGVALRRPARLHEEQVRGRTN